MKRKIKLVDNTGNKPVVIESETVVRDLDHFAAQLKFKKTVTRNRKAYTRHAKHKNKGDDYGRY